MVGKVLVSLCLLSLYIDITKAAACKNAAQLTKAIGEFTLSGKVFCGDEPLFGSYIQVADGFQSVHDIVSHGHTDLDGSYAMSGYYWYYADKDLAAPKGRWFIKIYNYCGMAPHMTNHCYRLTTFTVGETTECLDYPQPNAPLKLNNRATIPLNSLASNDKIICLDRKKRDLEGKLL